MNEQRAYTLFSLNMLAKLILDEQKGVSFKDALITRVTILRSEVDKMDYVDLADLSLLEALEDHIYGSSPA